MVRIVLAFALLTAAWTSAADASVGFQWAKAPDPDGDPLTVAIWYPTAAKPAVKMIGPFEMNVAVDAPVSGQAHPLIVMSHGTGGMALNSYDTAMALAEAGFIVAAVTHAGDNYLDHSVSFSERNFTGRPKQISLVIDFMLTGWSAHTAIDPRRIGLLGHSAGGTTALIAGGGVGDWRRVIAFCEANPDDWGCRQAREHPPTAAPDLSPAVSGADPRIKALVLAAPALAHMFQPDGLAAVRLPVQLWVGGKDAVVTDAASVRLLLPRHPDYHLVANAGHFAYLAPCSQILRDAAPEICADPPGFNRAAFLRSFQRSVVVFYRTHLG